MNSRLRRPAGALLATVVAASILGAVPSAYAVPIGTVSGTVTGPGGPLDTVSINAYFLDGESWRYFDNGYASTDVNGDYELTLPPGDYRFGFDDYSGGTIEEFYADAATVEDAQTVSVGDGATLDLDAVLAEASHITGTVTASGGDPIDGVAVAAYQELSDQGESYWQAVAFANDIDLAGNYDIGGLAAGTYRIEFQDNGGESNDPTYASEFYQNQPSVLSAENVVVGTAATTSGINAQLDLESTISGTVTDVNNAPLVGAMAYASVQAGAEWDYAGYAETDAAGGYTLDGLPTGTYKVEFQYGDGADSLFEVYNNKGTFDAGDNIAVGTAAAVGGISAQLIAGEHDLKYLEGVTIPMISGTPQVGSTLSVTAGTWTPSDISATYQWFNDDGPIAGATASTYVPTAADLGKTLVVLVNASYPGYQDRMNMSNVVGPITAAPVVAPPVVTPAPAPAPAPVVSFSKKIDVAGALTVGSTLKLTNFKALVSRAAVSYKIQWYAGSKKIKKATKSKLKVTKALKGKKISVKVSATSGTTTKTVKVKVGKIR